jgi:hypothetical protein
MAVGGVSDVDGAQAREQAAQHAALEVVVFDQQEVKFLDVHGIQSI